MEQRNEWTNHRTDEPAALPCQERLAREGCSRQLCVARLNSTQRILAGEAELGDSPSGATSNLL